MSQDPLCQLEILWCDHHLFGMYDTLVFVFEQADHINLYNLL